MKSYKHLNRIPEIAYDYQSSMMKKSLPERAFYNILTSNIMLSIQVILAKAFKATHWIRSYKSF